MKETFLVNICRFVIACFSPLPCDPETLPHGWTMNTNPSGLTNIL